MIKGPRHRREKSASISCWLACSLAMSLCSSVTLPLARAAATRDITVGPAPVVQGKILYGNSWAAVIGVNRYQHPAIKSLEAAVGDAQRMREALLRLGFPAQQIFTLTEGQATKTAIENLLADRLRRLAQPEDRAVVFFAGHGTTEKIRGDVEEGYLLPVDADPENLFATAISMTALKQIATRQRAKHVLFAVDACYSGYAIYKTRGITNPALVEELTRKPAIQIITAGRAGDLAQEREGQGIFTRVLIAGLEGQADQRGWGWVSLNQLGEYVQARVFAESDKRQLPQYGNLEGEGQFVFVLPVPEPPQPDPKARLEEERRKLEEEKRRVEAERKALEEQRRQREEQDRLAQERTRLEEGRKRLEEERQKAQQALVQPIPPSAPAPLKPPEEVYKDALDHYVKSNYDLAIAAFKAYIQDYPKTSLIPNAQYWLGDSYFSKKNYREAVEAFEVVIRNFPDHSKIPTALFKQGEAYLQTGNTKAAATVFCELMTKHPKTREAQLTRERNIRCGESDTSSQPSPQAATPLPPKEAHARPDPSRSGVEMLGAGSALGSRTGGGTALSSYLALVDWKIQQNWIPLTWSKQETVIVVRFRVLRSGSVRDLELETVSGNAELGASALRAVRQSLPLPPFPNLLTEPSLDLRYRFVVSPGGD